MLKFKRVKISHQKLTNFSAQFKVEPLERGFGYSLGNSLRRILLSSLPGAAITSIKIDGVAHEFSTIVGVREDVTDIILNLKELILTSHSEEPVKMRIKAEGPKEVKAKDIQAPAEVEIINPETYIASLNKEGKLEMEMTVERGKGYLSAEQNKKPTDPIGVIPIDSLFSPVKKVSFSVENARVGQRTDYDRLILQVETNGSLPPQQAVASAAAIMSDHMNLFIEQLKEEREGIFEPEEAEKEKVLDAPIEELDLSVRAYNCLKRLEINTLQQLVNHSEDDLLNLKNFGVKSMREVKEKLKKVNLSLKQS